MPRRLIRPVAEFLRLEAAGGIVLLAATVAALVWANLGPGGYEDVWGTAIRLDAGGYTFDEDLRHLVNDGLMALFFLVIGLEVKRELTTGELSSRGAAALPAVAALGGMVVPALAFLAIMGGADGSRGWGIPMATDVAFALAALAALGRRVPVALVAFLLGVAVIDDIGAIVVIALVYSDALVLGWLAGAVGGLALILVLQRIGVRWVGAYVLLGLGVWLAAYESGVHATIAGVALGLVTPGHPFQRPGAVSAEAVRIAGATSDDPDRVDAEAHHWRRLSWLSREAISPLERLENGLHPWSSFLVLPVFALANAGIVLDSEAVSAATDTPIALAVALALVLGKTVGLTAGALIAVRLGLSRLPRGVGWGQIVGVAALAGIGFTVSLFIADLAYADPDVAGAAKIGVLAGSLVAAVAGITLLLLASRRRGEPDLTPGRHLPLR